MELKITANTKEILDIYDANDLLLRAVPRDCSVNSAVLNSYKANIKSTFSADIPLLSQSVDFITALAQNAQAPVSLVFNFLIENMCDCGKVNTKKISRALDNYYEIITKAIGSQDQNARRLFCRLLNEYSESPFYDEQCGLYEKDIADFLTISREGQALVDDMELYNKQ